MSRLKDEFVAGRLSQDTFMHRVDLVMGTRRQEDLPPLVADLPAGPSPGGVLARWLRGTWSRVTGSGDARALGLARATTGLSAAPSRRQPFLLRFPRAGGDLFTIGRDAGCDLAVADLSVSRQHAQLRRTRAGWLLSDLESTNGTRVNGWRVRGQVPVGPGDLVSFGNVEVILAQLPAGGRPLSSPPVQEGLCLEARRESFVYRFARVLT